MDRLGHETPSGCVRLYARLLKNPFMLSYSPNKMCVP
jgi:hypothetical protein